MPISSHLEPKGSRTDTLAPASWYHRITAFVMDFVLLAVLLQLAVLFLPKLFDEAVEKEFQELLANAAMLSPDDHFDTEKMAGFIEDSGVSTKTIELMALIVVSALCIPPAYCFIGEACFEGKSLGKATFGLQALSRTGERPNFIMILIRSTCKGLAILCVLTPFFIPGLINFLVAFLNKDRRCLHDLLSGTVTIPSLAARKILRNNQNPELD